MCGICGFVGLDDKTLLERMCDVMRHRGPDESGIFTDKNVNIGMRRLSIIDLKTGHQPIYNEDKSVCTVFNGEIYNFRELRTALEGKGHKFYTNTDTEVIVHLYEEFGPDFVKHLKGMFAIAIWDSCKRRLLLARDTFGKKPLYYTFFDGIFFFASEIKSLLQYELVKREINYSALNNYLTFQYVPGEQTLFKGINKLPPAHILVYEKGEIKINEFWDLRMAPSQETSEEFYSKQLYELLKNSVKRRLISDVPLGAYLSGGIDSSTVVGIMSTLVDEPIKTFSVGFGVGEPIDELRFAKIVAEKFNTDHHELIVKAKSIKELPKVVWHLDEPIADPAAIPTYFMSELTKKYVTVILTGEGGDEIFAGYSKYRRMLVAEKLSSVTPGVVSSVLARRMAKIIPQDSKARRYFDYMSLLKDVERRYLLSHTIFKEEDKEKLYSGNLIGKTAGANPIDIMKPFFEKTNDMPLLNKMLLFDTKVWLPDDILMKVDKMTMAHSLEARAPLLDVDLVEFAATIPPSLKLKGSTEKYILKKAASGLVPKAIIERKKHGFAVPLNIWFTDELKETMPDILTRLHTKELFNSSYIFNHILKNPKNLRHEQQLWSLLIFEIWNKIFIEGDPRKPNLKFDELIGR